MRCVSGVAAWIVTNKADGFGLSFSATDAEYAWGVDRVVDDRAMTMSRSSFRRKGGEQYAHEQTPRRHFLATIVASTALVAMPDVRGSYPASKLTIGLWDYWVPGAPC